LTSTVQNNNITYLGLSAISNTVTLSYSDADSDIPIIQVRVMGIDYDATCITYGYCTYIGVGTFDNGFTFTITRVAGSDNYGSSFIDTNSTVINYGYLMNISVKDEITHNSTDFTAYFNSFSDVVQYVATSNNQTISRYFR